MELDADWLVDMAVQLSIIRVHKKAAWPYRLANQTRDPEILFVPLYIYFRFQQCFPNSSKYFPKFQIFFPKFLKYFPKSQNIFQKTKNILQKSKKFRKNSKIIFKFEKCLAKF